MSKLLLRVNIEIKRLQLTTNKKYVTKEHRWQ